MPVRWIPGRDAQANSYLFGDVLVDAGVVPMAVERYKDQISTIILTHGHYDHTAYLREIAHMCSARVCIHAADAEALFRDELSLANHFGEHSPRIAPDQKLQGGEVIGGLLVIPTPGHTAGSICLYSEEEHLLISGDTVFTDGACGRTDFPTGSTAAMEQSLLSLQKLDVEGLYPGHGEPVDHGGAMQIAAAAVLCRRGW